MVKVRTAALRARTVSGLAGACVLTLLALGCASAGSSLAPGRAGVSVSPWIIPPDAYPSQRLFRMRYDSAEGEGSLRLVLRLESPERFRLAISDRLGRPLYTLDVAGDGGLLLDHRERLVCRVEDGVVLRDLPVDLVAPASLPPLLLGRLPAGPAGRSVTPPPGSRYDFRDDAGRRWTAEVERGEVNAWTLWAEGEPELWWQRRGEDALLSDRRRGVQMTWREIGREALGGALGAPRAPADFAPGLCAPDLGEDPAERAAVG